MKPVLVVFMGCIEDNGWVAEGEKIRLAARKPTEGDRLVLLLLLDDKYIISLY